MSAAESACPRHRSVDTVTSLTHLHAVTSAQVKVLTGNVGESSHGGAAALPFSSRTSADALRVALRSEIGQ